MKNWIWIAALVTLIVGCSGKSSDTPALAAPSANGGGVATGGRHSTGGNSGTSMGGSGTVGGSTTTGGSFNQSTGGTSGLNTAGAAGQGLLTPTITIDSPAAAPDPDTGPVLLGSAVNVQVLCTATKSGAAGATDVAASSVKISLGSANGTPTVKQGAPVASQLNQYSAGFRHHKSTSGSGNHWLLRHRPSNARELRFGKHNHVCRPGPTHQRHCSRRERPVLPREQCSFRVQCARAAADVD